MIESMALLTAGTGISLSYDDSHGTLTITGQQGDITGIVAGTGLTGDCNIGRGNIKCCWRDRYNCKRK